MTSCWNRIKKDKFMWCAIVLQCLLGCAFAFFVEYGSESNGANQKNSFHEIFGGTLGKNTLPNNYYMFQDVHVMMFIGFGFLLMLMKRSNHDSTVPIYFLIVALSLQWGTLCYGFFHAVNGKIHLDIKSLLNADFTCATVLISCAAVIDNATPLQLVFMIMLEVIFSSTNKWIGSVLLQASDVGSSMFVHVFGAYFGLAVNFIVQRRCIRQQFKEDDRTLSSRSIVSVTVGTMILWLLWPSFNACLAEDDAGQFRAIINTYYSLSACCVTAFAVSTLVYNCAENASRENFNMVLFHNSTLVGGVVIGTSADMMINIWGSMIVGGVAGATSVFVDRYWTESSVHQKIGIRDRWGVNTLHGVPGIIAGLIGAIVSASANKEDYGFSLYRQFPARSPFNGPVEVVEAKYYDQKIEPGRGRTAAEQAGYQIATLIVTLTIAIVGGLGTGGIISLPFFRQESQTDDSRCDQSTRESEPIIILTEGKDTTLKSEVSETTSFIRHG